MWRIFDSFFIKHVISLLLLKGKGIVPNHFLKESQKGKGTLFESNSLSYRKKWDDYMAEVMLY
jgi:hypothetical protein